MTRLALRASVVAGLLVLAACGDGGETAGSEAGPAATATTAPAAVPTTAAALPTTEPGGSPASTSPGETAAPGTAATATTAPVAVPPILDLTAETVSDGPLSLAAYAGKPVALWFWAPG